MRTGTRRVLGFGLLAGAAYAAWRAWERSRIDTGVDWQPRPFPYPPEPVPAAAAAPRAWVDPDGSSDCPSSHPVKAKLASGIFHEPGGANYARTRPDRCYLSADAATADGLRPAKR